jgi:hypothetical protein
MTKDITLVAIEFIAYDLTKRAVERTLEQIDVKEVLVISDKEFIPGARTIIRPPVNGMEEYCNIMLTGTAEHVNTGHALYVQWDGMAYNREHWTNEFLDYDYIGAPWPWHPQNQNVGNGGFSLRSKKLLDICVQEMSNLPPHVVRGEDHLICVDRRAQLESQHGIKFPNFELASKFSFEHGKYTPGFGFHGVWNMFKCLDKTELEFYVDAIDVRGWDSFKWTETLTALQRRGMNDLYNTMINKLKLYNPGLIPVTIGK